jgi:transketolase
MRPYVCAYAPFSTARSMEQLRNDVAYARQRVVIGAAASGVSLGVAGGTHHALEDLALLRSFPNMTVIVPADAEEAWRATLATRDIDGPVYLRLGGRVEEPPVNPPGQPFRPGRATVLRPGKDIAIIACGALVAPALQAAETLAAQGVDARVINLHTIKPLDRETILAAAAETGRGAPPDRRPGRCGGGTAVPGAADPHAHGRHARRVRVHRPDAQGAGEVRHERGRHRGGLLWPPRLAGG